ncbi:MAG: hypothetical protein ACK48Y_24610, partial [Planctomyces sp.]
SAGGASAPVGAGVLAEGWLPPVQPEVTTASENSRPVVVSRRGIAAIGRRADRQAAVSELF